MNTQERTVPYAVIVLVAIAIAVAAIALVSELGALSSRQAQADHVPPVLLEGASNVPKDEEPGKRCSDNVGAGQTWTEFKLEEAKNNLSNGSHTEGPLTVTIINLTETTFDWTSNIGVDAVVVKNGVEGANLYVYDPPTEETADTELSVPGENNISHISFCYDEGEATPTPTPTTTPTPTPTPAAEASPTPTPTALAAVQEPEALPASGGTPADGSGLGILPLLLALSGLAFLGGAGTLVAAKVRRRR